MAIWAAAAYAASKASGVPMRYVKPVRLDRNPFLALHNRFQGADSQGAVSLVELCIPRRPAFAAADGHSCPDAGSAIKTDVLNRLPELLAELEAAVTARGGVVHWAADAAEANAIVTELIRKTGSDEVIKVKSMATQEIGLNEHLEEQGIAAYETDLAELIVQLGRDKPSHILVPAIHRNRAEIREIFLREMPDIDPDLDDNPRHLAAAARKFLRHKFMTVPVAVSGSVSPPGDGPQNSTWCCSTTVAPPRSPTRSDVKHCTASGARPA